MFVDLQFLADPRDADIMFNALRTAQRLVQLSWAKSGLRCVEVLPGPVFGYAADRRSFGWFTALFANTYFHACGTCAMNEDDAAGVSVVDAAESKADAARGVMGAALSTHSGVVDTQLRVKGVTGLRVADASVIPAIPSGPISAICMVLGDRAGRLILGEE